MASLEISNEEENIDAPRKLCKTDTGKKAILKSTQAANVMASTGCLTPSLLYGLEEMSGGEEDLMKNDCEAIVITVPSSNPAVTEGLQAPSGEDMS
ncbi:hypothetical protein FRB95_014119 [Tulasnella sp. JGI-2019a]|nr:hypothetical protein FRB95_014119 [Tulasnella sp. JGI-2019a]